MWVHAGPAAAPAWSSLPDVLSVAACPAALPLCSDGTLVNIKYRSLAEKKFWQVWGVMCVWGGGHW